MNRIQFQNRPLSDDEIRSYAPSAFAIQPWHEQSSRYAFVPTSDVIAGMRNAGFFPYSVLQARTRIPGKADFTKHVIRFRPENVNLSKVGDTAVEAVLINSHDGTSAYEISLGAFRLACLNGMMVSEGSTGIVHVRHTGNIIEEVVRETSRMIEDAPRVAETISRWKTIDLQPQEAMILAEGAHSLRFEDGKPGPEPVQLLSPHRRDDAGSDLWSTFNRVQENTVRGKVRFYNDRHERRRTREITGIAENVKLNRALWALAEKMAALKAVA